MGRVDLQSGILINPMDGFARSIFGVMRMTELLATSEKHGVPFSTVRDHIYDRLSDEERESLVRMAIALDRLAQPSPQA